MTHVSAPPDLIRRALPGERGMVVALGLSSRANGRECQGGQPRYVCYAALPPPEAVAPRPRPPVLGRRARFVRGLGQTLREDVAAGQAHDARLAMDG
jgi:hypothetical protein